MNIEYNVTLKYIAENEFEKFVQYHDISFDDFYELFFLPRIQELTRKFNQ